MGREGPFRERERPLKDRARAATIAALECILLAASILSAAAASAAGTRPPLVPGLVRDGLDPRLRGRVLLGELGCVSCHPAGPLEGSISTKRAPDLSSVGVRVSPDYLQEFIAQPRRVKPGTTMPDLLGARDAATRRGIARSLTHYLVSLAAGSFVRRAPDRIAAARGRKLFHEIGCVACHSPRGDDGGPLLPAESVPLERLSDKYSVGSLAAFLENPLRVRPGGRMPDLHLTPAEAYDIASYLTGRTRITGPLRYTLYVGEIGAFFSGLGEDLSALEGTERQAGLAEGFGLQGFERYRDDFALRFEGFLDIAAAGDYTFSVVSSHVARLAVDGRALISLARAGRAVSSVELSSGLHGIELVYAHSRGTPRLAVELSGPGMEKGPIPASMLRSERRVVPAEARFRVDRREAAKGKLLFADLGCIRCHAVEEPPQEPAAPPLARANPDAGCLSPAPGAAPYFALSPAQRSDILAALARPDLTLTPEERIRTTLATLNCIACHARDDWGGVADARDAYFRSADENLAEPGRLPPPLTGTGAKLQIEWLRRTLAHGQSIRPYMSTRMPAFGEANVAGLADLLARADTLPEVELEPLPEDREKARAIKDIGQSLVGDRGMNCVACHTFAGLRSGTMAALDLVDSTGRRLRPSWFYRYMLSPARFRSSTIMPEYFPGGVSVRPDIAGGDVRRQLSAMWHYLAGGRNTRRPSGIAREPMELVVGDEAVMLRRSAQDTGKRAISVGYPLKVNLTFDAESVSLNQMWRGRFIDASGVWSGQGSGSVRILSRRRLRLGKGPAFQVLGDDDPWPTASSRSLGIRFKGYELDEKRRPTFEYVFGDIAIADRPVDLRDEATGAVYLQRTLELRGPRDQTLVFRAAVNEHIEERRDGTVVVQNLATIGARGDSGDTGSLTALPLRVRPSAGGEEALVPVAIRHGRATLVLEYRWLEEPR